MMKKQNFLYRSGLFWMVMLSIFWLVVATSINAQTVINPDQEKVVPAEDTLRGAQSLGLDLPGHHTSLMTRLAEAPNNPVNVLILYDTSGPEGFLGELYAQMTANLVSHFGTWQAHPVGAYTAGEMSSYSAVIYIGSTLNEPLPAAFLTDTLAGTTQVVWMSNNISQLSAYSSDFQGVYGWSWAGFDFGPVGTVKYKQTDLTRDTTNPRGIMTFANVDPTRVQILAMAFRTDGSSFPWAVHSLNLSYIGEIPFAFMDHNDRYLVLADLLFDLLAPATVERHRALVRIEDVGPDADPQELRTIAEELSNRSVPFAVAVYPRYENPNGINNNGVPEAYNLAEKPDVVDALKFMLSKGGILLMHGYTHQFEHLNNPYDGVSSNDFEFYTAHVDANNSVIYDGPVPGDSQAWAANRIALAEAAFVAAGLPVPEIFEFPHYAGSVPDYTAVQERFGIRYDRGLYFPGYLSHQPIDYNQFAGQFFPYVVKDVYGSWVAPENLGNIQSESYNNHPTRSPADLLATARANLVVRDGFASFFYHPKLGKDMLIEVVDGIKQLGYTFVTLASLKP
ncbi:DUF2334 domain-containing protein [Nitrosomonas communis]|nr:polysaccharide deacetylase family protein [Nitrosomonas communis]